MPETRIVIYDSAIAAMSLPGGSTWRWAFQRRRRVERLAKEFAPSRTGEMKRSIFGYYEPARPNQIVMEVWCQNDHAIYVHEGTTGPILPRDHKYMVLKPAYGPYPISLQRSVRGQNAQPFLDNALQAVMRDL